MSESKEKILIEAFSAAWFESAETMLHKPSELSLLSLREVNDDQVAGALAVASTWSSAFLAACEGKMGGVLACLLKEEDSQQIERLVAKPTDGMPLTGVRSYIKKILEGIGPRVASAIGGRIEFGETASMDLIADATRLAAVIGDSVWVGTFSLTLEEVETQALLLYAPHGSLEALYPVTDDLDEITGEQSSATSGVSGRNNDTGKTSPPPKRDEHQPRNIERLLDVELDVVVRFGVTNVPLRDVVRMGVGTMIELNRAVDEPVELLVNGRSLARGEVVVVDGYYGVRITEIGAPSERALALM